MYELVLDARNRAEALAKSKAKNSAKSKRKVRATFQIKCRKHGIIKNRYSMQTGDRVYRSYHNCSAYDDMMLVHQTLRDVGVSIPAYKDKSIESQLPSLLRFQKKLAKIYLKSVKSGEPDLYARSIYCQIELLMPVLTELAEREELYG